MYKSILYIFLFSLFSTGFSQQNPTINGFIKDAESNEDIIGATIFQKGSMNGTVSNSYGFFSLKVNADTVKLSVLAIGYESKEITVFKNDPKLEIKLSPKTHETKEVEIIGKNDNRDLESTQMSTEKVTMAEAKKLPPIFGEVDIIKVLQMKPGIQSGGEGVTGIYVRGGGPDQNLILLDEAVVYNASHLFGFFSIFNPDAVKAAEIYKGGFPAQYGGRLSSVIDVKLNDGNKNKHTLSGGIGIITTRLTASGPLKKGKISYLVSGRRTYVEPFTKIINDRNKTKPDFNPIPNYYFYDMNAKIGIDIDAKNRLYIGGYFGRDKFNYTLRQNFNFIWGNSVGTIRWNHIFSPKLFSNTTFYVTDYRYKINRKVENYSFDLNSFITDYTVKTDFEYFLNKNHDIKFGAYGTYHQFSIGRLQAGTTDGSVKFGAGTNLEAKEGGVYFSDEIDINARTKINAGIRYSIFVSNKKLYHNPEPRFSLRYKLSENASFKLSYSKMIQYAHLVSNSGGSLPTDVWYPSNKYVKPERANQIAAGPTFDLFKKKWVFGYEFYYKIMRNQLDLRDGAQIFANPKLEQEFVIGDGLAYGNEFYLEKKEGKLHGWVSYTLSWNWRKFDLINNGEPFHPRYDQRHNLNIVGIYEINKRLTLSSTWVYSSGNAVTLPQGRFFFQDIAGSPTNLAIPIFMPRNSYRMPAYHRLDLALVYKFFGKKHESDLTFAIYNVYNRRNPYFIYFDLVRDPKTNQPISDFKFEAKQVSLFPIIPTLTYNFKF